MRVLLDTHVMLWLVIDDSRLSGKAKSVILHPTNSLFVSAVSYWEVAIKVSKGKLNLDSDWRTLLTREFLLNDIHWLNINIDHCHALLELPFHHRDPFDRLLIAQARHEGMHLLSRDRQFSAYDVALLW